MERAGGRQPGMESSLGLEDPVKEQKSQIVECESQGESSSREGLRFGDGICCSLRRTLPRERAAMLCGVWSTELWGAAEGVAAFMWGRGGSAETSLLPTAPDRRLG